MHDTCETVRVVAAVTDQNPHGYIVINKSDLTDAHELFEEAQKVLSLQQTARGRKG